MTAAQPASGILHEYLRPPTRLEMEAYPRRECICLCRLVVVDMLPKTLLTK